MRPVLTRLVWVGIALAAIVFPLLPLPEWTRAPDSGPAWGPNVESWLIGCAVVATLGVIAGRLAAGISRAPLPRWRLPDRWLVAGLALAFLAAALATSSLVFARNPLLVDEMAQLLHARAFAAGRLALPVPVPAAAFLTTQTGILHGGWVSQYPPGQVILFALGMLLRSEWLVNPLLGAGTVVLVYRLASALYGPQVARAAAFLWAASAWVLFTSASYMNHVGATALSLSAWALVFTADDRRPVLPWVLAGACLAWATATRPLDGVAAIVPVVVWIGARRGWRAAPWLIAGGLPVAVAWGYFNWRVFGNALTLGYSVLYGAEHGMGFHTDPFGQPFTPLVALSNAAVAVRRLHIYLYEWPIPALLPLALWAALGRQRSVQDLVVALGIITAPVCYFFYWHSGYFLGPRFYYAIAPFLVIGTARAWVSGWAMAGRAGKRFVRWDVTAATVALAVLVWGWVGVLPARWEKYRTELATLKLHPERELAAQGVRQALVLVTTSWSNRVIVDLWARGAAPGLVERTFRRVDTCVLDGLRRRASLEGWSGAQVEEAMVDLAQAYPIPVPVVPQWPDPSVRLVPGRPVTAECMAEMQRDLAGFTLFEQLAWRNAVGLDRGIVFARDRFELNGELLRRYAGWPVYRYTRLDPNPDAGPTLVLMVPGDDRAR